MTTITTRYGALTPQTTANELRRKDIEPTTYHANGQIKSVPLETQTPIETPAGIIPAELISFHENGTINRIFPLNGKLSGYWTQEDEEGLAAPVRLLTPLGPIEVRVISVSFYDNEAIRSLTLWPGESIPVSTAAGFIPARIGISFTRDGVIESLEPATPSPVKTLAGEITAFDPDAVGVNGDANSLMFDNDGNVIRVTTTLSKLKAVHPNGTISHFVPETRESLCSESEEEIVPMVVSIDEQGIAIQTKATAPARKLPLEQHLFFTEPYLPQLANSLEMMRCSV